MHTDEEHGYLDGLPTYVENPSREAYDGIMKAADKLLELATGKIVRDHWRRDKEAPLVQ